MNPRRILLTGDTHGNVRWFSSHVFKTAKKHRCDLIFQVGDFGIWPGREGQSYLAALEGWAKHYNIPIWFIDGNHEDFDQLYELPVGVDGLRKVREHITHVPRGHRWEWGGRRFLACGGATSIDVAYRLPRVSWWPQEAITTAEVDLCVAGGAADVMITHDAPLDVDVHGRHGLDPADLPLTIRNAAYGNRLALQHIVDAARPSLLIHGHWHVEDDHAVVRSADGRPMRVVSLNADGGASPQGIGHCAVLDVAVLAGEDVGSWLSVID